MENAVAAWATMPDKGFVTLEKVQARCLKTILGVNKHSASDAVNVIANVMPLRERIRKLCVLEYVRILQKPESSVSREQLHNACLKQNQFTPISYLKYQANALKGVLEELQLEPQHIVQLSDLVQECKITYSDTLDEGRFRKPLSKVSK